MPEIIYSNLNLLRGLYVLYMDKFEWECWYYVIIEYQHSYSNGYESHLIMILYIYIYIYIVVIELYCRFCVNEAGITIVII